MARQSQPALSPMAEDNRTRLPRASTLAYKELRPIQHLGDDGSSQQTLAEELCAKALTELNVVQNSLIADISQGSLPQQLGTALR